MGLMRFLTPTGGVLPGQLERAYLTGLDRVPWQSKAHPASDGFVIERAVGDSGYFHIPWRVAGQGEVVLSTGTLIEREAPYVLAVELARGKINQVREQIAQWQGIGLVTPKSVHARLHDAHTHFVRAVILLHQPLAAAAQAEQAIVAAVETAEALGACYSQQLLAARHRQQGRLNAFLGVSLGNRPLDKVTADVVYGTFNAAQITFNWKQARQEEDAYAWDLYDKQVEWCRANGVRIFGGPLLQMDTYGLPDWIYLWEGDYPNLEKFVEQHVQTTVARYRGKINFWTCSARANSSQALGLNEEERLRLAVRALEVTQDGDPNTPRLIRFDQPWGEYLNRADGELSPLHIADAIVRAGLDLAGIDLELNVGYWPGGTSVRDLVELSRLIDLWSVLGLPLFVSLCFPSSEELDSHAGPHSRVLAGAAPGGWSPEQQFAVGERYLELLLSKPAVRGVIWNQLHDCDPHEFPHSGLFAAPGKPKRLLGRMASLRRDHLE